MASWDCFNRLCPENLGWDPWVNTASFPYRKLMTLNNCASMKLEVNFQCKQVSHGKGGVWGLVAPWGTQDIHRPLAKLDPVSWVSGMYRAVPCPNLRVRYRGLL